MLSAAKTAVAAAGTCLSGTGLHAEKFSKTALKVSHRQFYSQGGNVIEQVDGQALWVAHRREHSSRPRDAGFSQIKMRAHR